MRSVNVPLFSSHMCLLFSSGPILISDIPIFFWWHLHIRWLVQAFLKSCVLVDCSIMFNIFQDSSFHVNSSNSCHVARVTSDTFWHFHAPAMDPGAPTRAPVSATSALQPSAWSASRSLAENSPRKYLSTLSYFLNNYVTMFVRWGGEGLQCFRYCGRELLECLITFSQFHWILTGDLQSQQSTWVVL